MGAPDTQPADVVILGKLVVAGGIVVLLFGIGILVETHWLRFAGERTSGRVVEVERVYRSGYDTSYTSRTRYRPIVRYTAEGQQLGRRSRETFSELTAPRTGSDVTVYYRSGDPSIARLDVEMGAFGTMNLAGFGVIVLGLVVAVGGWPVVERLLDRAVDESRPTRHGRF